MSIDQSNFFYPHTCIIYRSGELNDEGLETSVNLYTGVCGQNNDVNGNTTYQGISWQTSPSISIPDTSISFKTNDQVIVYLENEHILKASVKQSEVQTEEGMEGTTLWLKSGNDE